MIARITTSLFFLSALAAQAIGADDYPNKVPGTLIPIGPELSGNIEKPKDKDCVFFQPQAGKKYKISATKFGKGKVKLTLMNAAGGVLSQVSGGAEASLEHFAGSSEVVCIQVRFGAKVVGGYTLRVSEVVVPPSDEYYLPVHVGTIVANSPMPVSGAIQEDLPFDDDPFDLELAADTHALVRVGPSLSAFQSANTKLRIIQPNGTVLEGNDNGPGGFSQVEFTMSQAGKARVIVLGEGIQAGGYSVVATTTDDDWTAAHPGQIVPGMVPSASGKIHFAGDPDPFKMLVIAGNHYIVGTTAPALGGQVLDTKLEIDLGGGQKLADDDSGPGALSEIGFTAAVTDFVTVTVSEKWGVNGEYGITAQGIEDDWTPQHPGTAVAALNPFATAGAINFKKDKDAFVVVNLIAGKHYRIKTGAQPGQALLDTTLKLDLGGGLVLTADDQGANKLAELDFEALISDQLVVEVGATGSATGAYTLLVEELVDHEILGIIDPLTLNWEVASEIDWPGDVDGSVMKVVAGTTYIIATRPADDGSAIDTTIQVELGGSVLFDNDLGPGKLSYLKFKAPSNGLVKVKVQGNGSAVGAYKVATCIMGTDQGGGVDDHGDGYWNSTELLASTPAMDAQVTGGGDESDMFHFEATKGQIYTVTLSNVSINYLQYLNATAYVTFADGSIFEQSTAVGQPYTGSYTISFAAPADGPCYLRLKNSLPSVLNFKVKLN